MRIYAGTDAGSVIKHGRIVDELEALHAAGLPAAAALDAGAWAARGWLGAEAITEGASADVLVCAEDPRARLGHLRGPQGHRAARRGDAGEADPAIRNKLKLQVI